MKMETMEDVIMGALKVTLIGGIEECAKDILIRNNRDSDALMKRLDKLKTHIMEFKG